MIQLTADLAMKEADQYLETFERFEAQAKQPAWIFPLRKAGIARFAELGFPTLQQEDWRFTNVAPIAKLRPPPKCCATAGCTPATSPTSIATAMCSSLAARKR